MKKLREKNVENLEKKLSDKNDPYKLLCCRGNKQKHDTLSILRTVTSAAHAKWDS